ncbi:MAG: AmmeMemoRadiSam system protein B [Oceanospirillales bacterium]|nr:AmmeMemoRadiSam system protein B [Oceanospirillales bacterium]
MDGSIRPAAVAGAFYPADPLVLKGLVDTLMSAITAPELLSRPLKACVVPHAGLIYSGPVAAAAYRLLQSTASHQLWRRVVLLGPNHRMPLHGMAVSDEAFWSSPLGRMPIDRAYTEQLCTEFQLTIRPDVHRFEHSLEVQLPFLQTIMPKLALVPVLVGGVESEDVAALIEYCWQDESSLVLVSSDLSHYHPWSEAQRLDAVTSKMINTLDAHLGSEQACGYHALNGLLLAAQRQGLEIHCLSRLTSGDTAGSKEQVVGYGAYVCY